MEFLLSILPLLYRCPGLTRRFPQKKGFAVTSVVVTVPLLDARFVAKTKQKASINLQQIVVLTKGSIVAVVIGRFPQRSVSWSIFQRRCLQIRLLVMSDGKMHRLIEFQNWIRKSCDSHQFKIDGQHFDRLSQIRNQ